MKVRNATSKKIAATRLTWQASQRDKFGFYIDYTKNCSGSSVDAGRRPVPRSPATAGPPPDPASGPACPTTSPESGTIWDARAKIMQATYSAPWSSRVLVEAGFSSFWTEWGDIRPAGSAVDRIPVTEQSSTHRHADVELHLPRLADHRRHGSAERAVSRFALVCHRLAQHEDRLPGRLHGGQDADVRRASRSAIGSTTASRTRSRSGSGRR